MGGEVVPLYKVVEGNVENTKSAGIEQCRVDVDNINELQL